MDGPYDLQRFIDAQDSSIAPDRSTYDEALEELRAGRKAGHWIWFVFPQMDLGVSFMSRKYAIESIDEAGAYLHHEVLGPRLEECCQALLALQTSDPWSVLGSTDSMKLRSSMTLFAEAASGAGIFHNVLERFFGGERDTLTLKLLEPSDG